MPSARRPGLRRRLARQRSSLREEGDILGLGISRLAAFLFPAACLGCGRSGETYYCKHCRADLERSIGLLHGSRLLTLGSYEGALQRCLTAAKQRGHRAVAGELCCLGAESLLGWCGPGERTLIYSIRPSRAGGRFRGYSLPQMMEQTLIRGSGWSALEQRWAKGFPDHQQSSKGMGLEGRLERHHRPQAMGAELSGSVVPEARLVIIDDVVTTGATMGGAVDAARALGFRDIVCFALARASDV